MGMHVIFACGAWGQCVMETEREIPVAYNVDVVVVGGSSAGVAAAVAAADAGAKVFLAAPRPYLGEDIAGTLRLWADPKEKLNSPLAEKLFGSEGRDTGGGATEIKNGLPFSYKADKPSADKHKDTSPPSLLSDGKWHSAPRESVQYDGEVSLVADLGNAKQVAQAGVMAYHAKDYLVDSVTVAASDDGKAWKDSGLLKNSAASKNEADPALPLLTALNAQTRYVRFHVKPAPESKRVLLGEIVLTGPEKKTEPRPSGSGLLANARGSEAAEAEPPVLIRPLHIKRALDEALIAAGVQYLFGCYACDVLRDAQGNLCGIAMANRAGRQAVAAKVIIDATDRAWVARMAGAKAPLTLPSPQGGEGGVRGAGAQVFKRVVIGGEMRTGENLSGRKLSAGFGQYSVFDYILKLPMADGSFAAWARAEQLARNMTYHENQQFASDLLFQVPPDPIEAVKTGAGDWAGVAGLAVDSFRPAGVERLFVLSGCADIPRPQAEKLLEPPALLEMGTRIGAAAAALAKPLPLPAPRDLKLVAQASSLQGGVGDVKEVLSGVRPNQNLPVIEQAARGLPVLGSYDVVVVGGGTSGAPAGIAAARRGAKTLVLEYQCGLGGVGTLGLITKYYWGNTVGFTKEVPGGGSWNPEQKAEWWRATLLKAGGELWFGAMGCGAYVEDGRVRGAIVATPQGRGVVLAKVVIDATGNADVAAAAGAECVTTGANDVALQGTGLPPRDIGKSYTNTDYAIVDETDMLDVWQILVYGKQMAGKSMFDFGTLIDTRERRRIVGDFTITILDEVLDRTYPDTVVQARSNFDTHGYTVDPFFTLSYPHHKGLTTNIPYRSLLPKGVEGLLVVGLGMSVHRDALPVVRMQPDLQNMGYAAGVAGAMVAKTDTLVRGVDMKALQKHLVDAGNLKESVLTDQSNFPLPPERIQAAVRNLVGRAAGSPGDPARRPTSPATADPEKDIAVILAHPEESRPLVKQAFAASKDPAEKLKLAEILSVLGDPAGLDTLIAAVSAAPELDKGWKYVGMGQFGASMSPLDSIVYALGRIGDRKATPALVAKLKLLKAGTEFSHFRALATALDQLRDPAAAGPLAEVLSLSGVRGQAIIAISGALESAKNNPSWTATAPRADALRELFLARALFHCGDKDGLGRKVLEEYSKDLRGHLARHASAVLGEGKK